MSTLYAGPFRQFFGTLLPCPFLPAPLSVFVRSAFALACLVLPLSYRSTRFSCVFVTLVVSRASLSRCVGISGQITDSTKVGASLASSARKLKDLGKSRRDTRYYYCSCSTCLGTCVRDVMKRARLCFVCERVRTVQKMFTSSLAVAGPFLNAGWNVSRCLLRRSRR